MLTKLYDKSMEVSGCYIGDPCYATDDMDTGFYAEWGHKNYADGADVDGAMIYGTGIGDGLFAYATDLAPSRILKERRPGYFEVDSGTLSVVDARVIGSNVSRLNSMLYVPEASHVRYRVYEMSKHVHNRKHCWDIRLGTGSKLYYAVCLT